MLKLIPIPAFKDNYIWTFIDDMHHNAIVVDPGDAKPVQDYLQTHQLNLIGILITHHHWDHTNGVIALKNAWHAPVFGPHNQSIAGITHPVTDHDVVQIEHFPLTLQVLTIPGHTLDHLAYYSPGLVFCGDTLFTAGCGRLFEGTAEQMFASLQNIASLPDTTHVYCAHEYTLNNLRFAKLVEPRNPHIDLRMATVQALREKNLPSLPSTLADEKLTNPFLRCDSQEIIESVAVHFNKKLNQPVDVFRWLREWKDTF